MNFYRLYIKCINTSVRNNSVVRAFLKLYGKNVQKQTVEKCMVLLYCLTDLYISMQTLSYYDSESPYASNVISHTEIQ